MLLSEGTRGDIDAVTGIIEQAREYLGKSGVDQWQRGPYPSREDLLRDIDAGHCVVLRDGGRPVAVAAVIVGVEPTYARINGGRWLSDGEYATVHRLAVSDCARGRGAASELLSGILDKCAGGGVPFVRADTHADNLPMRRALTRAGFALCGEIFLADGAPRLAYEASSRAYGG